MTPGQTDLARRVAADPKWPDGPDQLPDLTDDATAGQLMRMALEAGSQKGPLYAEMTGEYDLNPGALAAVFLLEAWGH